MHVVLSGRIRAELRLCPQASHPTVHPHLSAFYLHPADLLPSPSSLLPSTFIFFFFWPLHIISIFPASVAFSSHTPPPPSSHHHQHHHHHLPPAGGVRTPTGAQTPLLSVTFAAHRRRQQRQQEERRR